MLNFRWIPALVLIVVFAFLSSGTRAEFPSGYVGSKTCGSCHESIYNRFIDSGHPFKIRSAELAEKAGFPLPQGYTWNDIFYVIGGETKKIRYINREGFIITAAKDGGPLPTQYNLATGKWVDYHPGERKAYNCGACHTTGYQKDGHQHGRAGMIGTWAMDGIQCEACHEPGSQHTTEPRKNKPVIDRSAAACGRCHIRGEPVSVPAKGNFIKHHEQYNELLMGSHNTINCVVCHDPHAKLKVGIKANCSKCHPEVADKFAQEIHHGANQMECIICHMPYASISAESFDNYVADVRTHLFRINTEKDHMMFTEDGRYARSALSLEYVCLPCHRSKTKAWAAEYAEGFHRLVKR